MGARSHYLILDHIDNLSGSIVEIGCGRGEGSTDFYAGLVAGIDRFQHHAIDFDSEPYQVAANYASKIIRSHAHCMTGEKFLQEVFPGLGEKICYAYLDNFDFNYDPANPPWWVNEQIKRYAQYGIEMTNANSELAHLTQAQLIIPYAAPKCIIQFDDTFKNHGNGYNGKGGSAVPYLQNAGWTVIHESGGSVSLSNF